MFVHRRGWFRIKGRVTVRFWISYMHMTFTHGMLYLLHIVSKWAMLIAITLYKTGEMADGCPTVSNVRCSAKIRRVRVKVRGGLLG